MNVGLRRLWSQFDPNDDFAMEEERTEALLFVGGGLLVVASYLMTSVSNPAQPSTWVVPAGMVVLVAVTFLASRQSIALGSVTITVGLVALLAIGPILNPDAAGTYPLFFPPVVVAAAVIMGPPGAFAGAIVFTALICLEPLRGAAVDTIGIPALLLLLWSSTVLSWLAHRPLRTALVWALSSYDQALLRTQELQSRQGELNRTLKSLNESYYRLERLNDELAQARHEAEEARRLKAEFAANVSHELRTPLNLIIGFTEMMIMAPETYGGQPLPAPYRSDLEAVFRNACHLSNLINDILDISQVEASHMALIKERTDLASIAEEAARVVGGIFRAKDLSLDVNLTSDLPLLLIDRTRIRQVFINLLNNAARFTSRGGVTVTARMAGNDILAAVSDTGEGIAAEDLSKVFHDFYQIDGSIKRRQGGTGLGLSICRRFIEMHGGSIWAESQPGLGSTFYFTLPLASNVVAGNPPGMWLTWDRSQKSRPMPERALVVVSDSAAAARTLQRYLHGYRVEVASSLAEAEGFLGNEAVKGLVLSSSSVDSLFARLREIDPATCHVPVALCSLTGLHDSGAEIGAAAYLIKPVARTDLLKTVQGLGRPVHRALVVDDDPEVTHMLGRMLRSAGVRGRLRYAYNGVEALAILSEWRPDVVLLDLLMPAVSGYEVLRRMRENERLLDIPVIVITARGESEEVVRASMVGIARPHGLSVDEFTRCLVAGLEELAKAPGSDREPAGEPAE